MRIYCRALSAVPAVPVAEQRNQVRFLQTDADEDVSRRCDREEQVSDRHMRSGPEGQQEPGIDRVPHMLVEGRRLEGGRGQFAATHPRINLPEPEQLEVVDQERAAED